ncbi:hypothetical protein ACFW34_35085 [Streptomyces sp. NPDC058848]|uniref:hypothetical protein n=1 Tax=Streptomyces sp. NPDC058848 TaxID=3346650 RepID=UPI0036B94614
MLHAVPAQPSPAPQAPREAAFRRAVEGALQLDGADALTEIMRLYHADTHALQARADGLSVEASEMAEEKRRHWTMLTQLQAAASHKLWEGAKMSAEIATYREMFGTVRRLADRAAGEPIPWEDVAAALAIEPLEPAHAPVALTFVPDDKYRGGQFVAEPTRDVTFVFTFIGWSLIDHGPGAYGILEPMFLVEDRAMARSAIEAERHVRLESYLPHLERVA